MTLPPSAELLHLWDAQRERSQQAEMGMSKLGSCRRQAGYHLQGYEPDPDFEADKTQAILGTAIHDAIALATRMFYPQAHTESLEVHFGGLKGHPDVVYGTTVRDIKTLGYSMVLETRRQFGPPQRERFQVHTYGAGLILAGHVIDTVEIDYLARDSGEEWIWREPFSMEVVQQAAAWLEEVRTAEVITLPRDFRPASAFCATCPFFTRCWDAPRGTDDRHVLFVDDPDLAAWARKLEETQRQRREREDTEDDAKLALDHLRTVSRPGDKQYVKVPGLDKVIRFSVNRGRTSPDMALIAADYARAGARPPMRYGNPVIRVALVDPPAQEDS